MRRWGIIITAFYGTVIYVLLFPLFFRLVGTPAYYDSWASTYNYILDEFTFTEYFLNPWALLLISGQALLMFISVDTSWRRFKPRRQIQYSVALTALLMALLALSIISSLLAAIRGEDGFDLLWGDDWTFILLWMTLWSVWGCIFYLYYRNKHYAINNMMSWLFKGSVLGLLIAVPSHVIVRQRGDCSAPIATSFGIVTGIAIMFMCFGPGVIALYKKRIEAYQSRTS